MPNARNRWHQKYCPKPACRWASKAASQRRWLSKPENRAVFRGSANVERGRAWRAQKPGYWKRRAKEPGTLQDLVPKQPTAVEAVTTTTSPPSLQDLVATQDPLLVGLIAHLIDSPLQENVERATLRLLEKGRRILDARSGMKPKGLINADQKTNLVRGTAPAGAAAV